MIIDLLVTLLYMLLLGLVVRRAGFFKLGGTSKLVLAVFLCKCLLSAVYWLMHVNDYLGGDTYMYFKDGEIVANTIYSDPLKYLQLTFGFNGGNAPANIAPEIEQMGFWYDTSAYMVVRFNAIIYLFSQGNPYVHGVFMSFISTIGLTALYKAVAQTSLKNHFLIKLAVFGIPSVLFWTSGVHKEGLLIFGLGLFFYALVSIDQHGAKWANINLLIISAIFVFLVRDFMFYLLLPGIFTWQLSKLAPRWSPLFLLFIYCAMLFAAPYVKAFGGHKHALEIIADKQVKFKSLDKANTDFGLTDFQPSRKYVLKHVPIALYNVLVLPITVGWGSLYFKAITVENSLLLLTILVCLMAFDYKNWHYQPLMFLLMSFGLSLLVIIGFIVPNVGAIVRYRSIALPFLLIPLLYYVNPSGLDWLKHLVRPRKTV